LNDQASNQVQLSNPINSHKGSKQKIFMYFYAENIKLKLFKNRRLINSEKWVKVDQKANLVSKAV